MYKQVPPFLELLLTRGAVVGAERAIQIKRKS